MFALGIFIWAGIIGFILSFGINVALKSMQASSIMSWINMLVLAIAIFAAAFIACKRYMTSASNLMVAVWVGVIAILFTVADLLLISAVFSSGGTIFAFLNVNTLEQMAITFAMNGVVTYIALSLFSTKNSTTAQPAVTQ